MTGRAVPQSTSAHTAPGALHGKAHLGGLDQNCDRGILGEAKVLDGFAGDGGGNHLSAAVHGYLDDGHGVAMLHRDDFPGQLLTGGQAHSRLQRLPKCVRTPTLRGAYRLRRLRRTCGRCAMSVPHQRPPGLDGCVWTGTRRQSPICVGRAGQRKADLMAVRLPEKALRGVVERRSPRLSPCHRGSGTSMTAGLFVLLSGSGWVRLREVSWLVVGAGVGIRLGFGGLG